MAFAEATLLIKEPAACNIICEAPASSVLSLSSNTVTRITLLSQAQRIIEAKQNAHATIIVEM